MIGDRAFVELAQWCARACHKLKVVAERKGMGGAGEPTEKAVKNLEL